jgi:hypothetical protein
VSCELLSCELLSPDSSPSSRIVAGAPAHE